MSSKSLRRFIWGAALVSLLWAIVLALNLVPSLRGDYGWRWPYAFPPEHPERLLWLGLALGLYVVGAWVFSGRRSPALLLLWAVIGSVGLTLAALYVTTSDPFYELYARTVSGLTTGGHDAAARIDEAGGARAVLSTWPDFARSFGDSSHVSTSPPGIPLIYYAADRLLEQAPALANSLGLPLRAEQCHNLTLMDDSNAELASAWLGMLSPLWAGLTILPLYWLGRCAYSRVVAYRAILWWPLIPALVMFTPHPSTVYPLLAVSAIAMLTQGLAHRHLGWAVASGITISLMIFINYSLLPMIFLAGFLAVLDLAFRRGEGRFDWRLLFMLGLCFVGGLVSIWLVYYGVSGLPPWTILDVGMSEHLALDRPYFPWLILTLNDFFMFTGWPLVLVAGMGIWQAAQTLKERTLHSTGAALSVALPVTLLALDFSGTVQGESGRILLYLSPFVLLIAASALPSDDPDRSGWIVTAAQAVMVLVMVSFVHVIDSGLSRPPASPPPLSESPQVGYLPSGAVFNGALRLERFAGVVEMRPGADGRSQPTLVLWLDWRSVGQVDRSYYLSFIPVAPDGQAASQATLIQPFDARYPTTCWLPSSGPIRDRYEIPLPAPALQGDWWVSLSLVDGQTGEKPAVLLPDGSQDTQVGIGPFRQN